MFADGWLRPGQPADAAWGRPVGLLRMPDGSMLVGDDKAGAVYRISFNESAPASGSAARVVSAGALLLACALLFTMLH